MANKPCALCGSISGYEDAQLIGTYALSGPLYDCPNCGRYRLDRTLEQEWSQWDEGDKFRLACLLREHKLQGHGGLFGIFPDTRDSLSPSDSPHFARWQRISELLSEFPSATQLIDRGLMNLSALVRHPMDRIKRPAKELAFLMFCPAPNLGDQLAFMEEMYLLRRGDCAGSTVEVVIAPAGWERIDQLKQRHGESRQAFVAMWFSAEMDGLYRNGFAPAIQEAGYEPKRIDCLEHNNKICDQIVAEIRRSRFLVADFTAGSCKQCEKCELREGCKEKIRARGGVYFEAGFAMGLRIPVIWTVREEQIDEVHFDTRQYNHIVYRMARDLRERLRNRIEATIH